VKPTKVRWFDVSGDYVLSLFIFWNSFDEVLLEIKKEILFIYVLSWVRYIVVFPKVLTIYQIFLNLPPPPFSFISPTLHSWNNFNRYHFFHLYTCVHSIYTLFHHCPTSSPFAPVLIPQSRTCSALLFSGFV
jgi:hypothetical protein